MIQSSKKVDTVKKIPIMVTALYSLIWLSACATQVSDEVVKAAHVAVDKGAVILDVRTLREFNGGHIKGAINIPIQYISQLYASIPQDKEIVVYCQSGSRSQAAASFLRNKGRTVYDIGSQRVW